MKKIILSMAAISAIALVSCSKSTANSDTAIEEAQIVEETLIVSDTVQNAANAVANEIGRAHV